MPNKTREAGRAPCRPPPACPRPRPAALTRSRPRSTVCPPLFGVSAPPAPSASPAAPIRPSCACLRRRGCVRTRQPMISAGRCYGLPAPSAVTGAVDRDYGTSTAAPLRGHRRLRGPQILALGGPDLIRMAVEHVGRTPAPTITGAIFRPGLRHRHPESDRRRCLAGRDAPASCEA